LLILALIKHLRSGDIVLNMTGLETVRIPFLLESNSMKEKCRVG
jgi:hypothetical protein